ncbi:glycerophosphodiester phosphodiesterase [Candidatus Xianfuyuplasma coldseepsis]|uniref:GP-PDE domain-containing protein n=1 Tax=Candidatus Xianfuyuplasma coldseepsis TaxID=2782163 RepID=A0A7L7KSA0_9MOLU|nr:glycerophosphodiester phosphodiesterase family protein [Xianfuyuplasma coldseepsis]QMS85086.1 hypothetical protein G4Z02_04795 [Xianfuyuplasma coldseepsis]
MDNKPFITIHRGGGNDAPENTLYAIRQGLKYPVDAIEFDVRFTKDHIPVLLHDASLKRTTTEQDKRYIKDVTLEEARTFDATSWFDSRIPKEPIPTLEEALQLLQGKKQIFIEIKAHDPYMGLTIKRLLETYNMVDDVFILSFYKDILLDIKEHIPTVHCTFIFSRWRQPFAALLDPRFDSIGPKYRYLYRHPKLVKFLKEHNKPIYTWSVNKMRHIKRFIKWKIEGITTDKPTQLLHYIEKQSTRE